MPARVPAGRGAPFREGAAHGCVRQHRGAGVRRAASLHSWRLILLSLDDAQPRNSSHDAFCCLSQVGETWLAKHFELHGDRSVHFGANRQTQPQHARRDAVP